MSQRKLNSYDGIGTWKRRPIRASKKTYMPSHKRWGKVTVMPTPEGFITTSDIWQPAPEAQLEDASIPFEKIEVEEEEENETEDN